MQIVLFLGDLDCTPPDDSLCADVEDQPEYIIYHFYPCKLASIDEYTCFPLCFSLEKIRYRIIILESYVIQRRHVTANNHAPSRRFFLYIF